MEYAVFGATGATVSRIGFGGAVLGLANYLDPFDPGDPADRTRMFEGIETALEHGINLFDTAPDYGSGEGERVLGQALAGVADANGVPLFVSSKADPRLPVTMRESVERTLTNLRRDRLDLILVNGDSYTPEETDRILAPGGTAEQLLELKAEGLVGSIGFSTEDNNDSVYRMIRSGHFDAIQLCYNLLFQHPYEPSRPFGTLYVAQEHGLGIMTMRGATSGTLQRWIRMVNPANTFDYTPALIQFVLSNPLVDSVLVGMRDADTVRANVAIVDDLAGRIDLDALHTRYVG